MIDNIETYHLPSKGLYYNGSIPDGIVKIRPLTTKDEAYLAGTASPDEKVNQLINRCLIVPEGFDPMDLLSSDRAAVLFQIRRYSYGDDYSFTYVCTACKNQGKYSAKMSEFKIVSPPEDAGPYRVKLPKCGKVVEFRFLTGKEDERLNKAARLVRSKITTSSDTVMIPRLAAHIVSIDGESYVGVGTSVSEMQAKHDTLVKFVENLVVLDTRALRKEIAKREPGVNPVVDMTCHSCGFQVEGVLLPITADFFHPTD